MTKERQFEVMSGLVYSCELATALAGAWMHNISVMIIGAGMLLFVLWFRWMWRLLQKQKNNS